MFGAFDTEEFDGVRDAPRLAQTSGVDQQVVLGRGAAAHREGHIDGIPGRAWDGADDHALGLGERVDERRLAHIRAADDGEFDGGSRRHRRTGHFGSRGQGQQSQGRIHQRRNTAPVDGGHGVEPRETQFAEFRQARFHLRVVCLVHGHEHRFARNAQQRGDFPIERYQALLDVRDEDNHLRRLDGQARLVQCRVHNGLRCLLPGGEPDAPRVHQRERVPAPLGLRADAIARDARLVMHDGNAPPGKPVKQGRLAHIRSSDDRD